MKVPAVEELMTGISSKTTKEELTSRLRKMATLARKGEREKMTRLQEIEERLRSQMQDAPDYELRQVIVNGTMQEWAEMEMFLSEFHEPDKPSLLPPSLQRLLIGARVMLGDVSDGNA